MPPCGTTWTVLADARRMVIGLLNAISAEPQPAVFVLDELEAVTEAAVYDEIGVLVERAPSNLHLVVTTRYDPPLALARLRARGLLSERGVPELRFTVWLPSSTVTTAAPNGSCCGRWRWRTPHGW